MIEVSGLTKKFGDFTALNHLNLHINKGSICGLIGVNGSGKTTLIKHITGVLQPDEGSVTFDGQNVYDNEFVKLRTGFIPDDLYFFSTYNLKNMKAFYAGLYPAWNEERYQTMLKDFDLPEKVQISKFSKGMQKQAAFILTMSIMPEFLILDEPVDGLDPLVRRKLWKYVMNDVAEKSMTVLISSHNLRELDGVCDSVCIINKGSVVLEGDLEDLKAYVQQLQEKHGQSDDMPMTLEEVFIYEMEGGLENEK